MGSLGFDHAKFEEPVKERAAQKSYWADHSATASVEAMMLDSQAAVIDKEERPEVRVCDTLLVSFGLIVLPSSSVRGFLESQY